MLSLGTMSCTATPSISDFTSAIPSFAEVVSNHDLQRHAGSRQCVPYYIAAYANVMHRQACCSHAQAGAPGISCGSQAGNIARQDVSQACHCRQTTKPAAWKTTNLPGAGNDDLLTADRGVDYGEPQSDAAPCLCGWHSLACYPVLMHSACDGSTGKPACEQGRITCRLLTSGSSS